MHWTKSRLPNTLSTPNENSYLELTGYVWIEASFSFHALKSMLVKVFKYHFFRSWCAFGSVDARLLTSSKSLTSLPKVKEEWIPTHTHLDANVTLWCHDCTYFLG